MYVRHSPKHVLIRDLGNGKFETIVDRDSETRLLNDVHEMCARGLLDADKLFIISHLGKGVWTFSRVQHSGLRVEKATQLELY